MNGTAVASVGVPGGDQAERLVLPPAPTGGFSFDLCVAVGLMLDQDLDRQLYHNVRVAYLAAELAHALAVVDLPLILHAALLHDIGGVFSDDHLVHKLVEFPSSLSQKGEVDLFFHPSRGRDFLHQVPGLAEVARLVGAHHETFDGLGYPEGLRGDELPLEAQLLHAADLVDQLLRDAGGDQLDVVLHNLKLVGAEEHAADVQEAMIELLRRDSVFPLLGDGERLLGALREYRPYLDNAPLFPSWGAVDRLFELWSALVDVRGNNPSTHHSRKVARLAGQLGEHLGMSPADLRLLRWSALLMNVGQMGLGRSVLLKTGRLDGDEIERIRRHPRTGRTLIAGIAGLEPVARIVDAHHEDWDGQGYPERLAGDRIPGAARLLRVADSFTAMSSDRPYMKRRDLKRAQREIRLQADRQYDPRAVEVLAEVLAG